jgi:hypothetical protein
MAEPVERSTSSAAGRARAARGLASLLLAASLLGAAQPASAEEYDSTYAGHPLRVVAYVVHPIGVILDTLIFRPFHWIGSHEPLKTLFGQQD